MEEQHPRSPLGSTVREFTPFTGIIAIFIVLAGLLLTYAVAAQHKADDETESAEEFRNRSARVVDAVGVNFEREVSQFAQSLRHVETTFPAANSQFDRYFAGLANDGAASLSGYVLVEPVEPGELDDLVVRDSDLNPGNELDPIAIAGRQSLVVTRSTLASTDNPELDQILADVGESIVDLEQPVSFLSIEPETELDASGNATEALLVGLVRSRRNATVGYLVRPISVTAFLGKLDSEDFSGLNVDVSEVSQGRLDFSYRSDSGLASSDARFRSSASLTAAGTTWEVLTWMDRPDGGAIALRLDSFWMLLATVSLVVAWLMWSSRDRRTVDASRRVRKATELAHTDKLTGLLNKGGLADECRKLGDVSATLFFVDLNHFKAVNDTYGHDMGDSVLVSVADALRNATRPMDKVARVGGDEFVIVMPGMTDRRRSVRLARAIERSIAGMKTGVTGSVGVASSYPKERLDLAELMGRADKEMYERKQVYHAKISGHGSSGIADGDAPEEPAVPSGVLGGGS